MMTLTLPRINEYMTTAVIEAVYVAAGGPIEPGTKLLDLRIDLSAIVPHDCPPVSFYRIALGERTWLHRLRVRRGDEIPVGTLLAEFGAAPDEPTDGKPVREVRISIAGILDPVEW